MTDDEFKKAVIAKLGAIKSDISIILWIAALIIVGMLASLAYAAIDSTLKIFDEANEPIRAMSKLMTNDSFGAQLAMTNQFERDNLTKWTKAAAAKEFFSPEESNILWKALEHGGGKEFWDTADKIVKGRQSTTLWNVPITTNNAHLIGNP